MFNWVHQEVAGVDANGDLVYWKKGYCLSTDTKPTDEPDTANGSEVTEIDTGHVCYWDASTEGWLDPQSP